MRDPKLLTSILLACATATAACTTDGDGSLTVFNDSDFVIVDLRLTEVDNPDFGPNLLGGDVLLPGESITLGVGCDFYDALVVDEDGAECRLFDLDLCLNDADWVISNNTCIVFDAAP